MAGEAEIRSALVMEARTWLRTPWHHRARVKGAGVDCAQLVNAVYHAVVGTALSEVDYSIDHFIHREGGALLPELEAIASIVPSARPGDIVVYRFGRAMSHAGIVTAWPDIIHAYRVEGRVVLGDGDGGRLAGRERCFYRWIGFEDRK